MSTPRHATRRRRVWPAAVVIGIVAAGVGVGAAVAGARWSDERVEVLSPPVTTAAEELPVLAPVTDGGAEPSPTGGVYALEPFAAETRAAVLASWGVAAVEDAAPAGGSGPDVNGTPTGGQTDADDALATDGAVPHARSCTTCTGTEGIVLGGRRDPPANGVRLIPYPRPEDAVADECGFGDVGADEVPVAIVTGNPGEIEIRLGRDRYVVESDADERDEWEAWMDGPAGARPSGSLVVHCVALPVPEGDDPVVLSAEADDGTGHLVAAVAALVHQGQGRAPIVLTPIDRTLLSVSVPLPDGTATASVTLGPPEDGCGRDGRPGWRPGSERIDAAPAAAGERPYLADAPAALRSVVALPEGEPTLLCITVTGQERRVLVTPPDARRLTLAVTDVQVPAGAPVEVQGVFPSLGWMPCSGPAVAGHETILCESGGDTGALLASGGLLDVAVVSGAATQRARIPLSAAVGGADEQRYRLAAPGGAGTVEVTARWDDGATGAGDTWRFTPTA